VESTEYNFAASRQQLRLIDSAGLIWRRRQRSIASWWISATIVVDFQLFKDFQALSSFSAIPNPRRLYLPG
jgi:hypothetical protein